MKKQLIALCIAASALSAMPVMAQEGGFSGPDNSASANAAKGGFQGPDAASTTVNEAKNLRDDAWVVLEGNIVRKLGKELYEFRDASGSVNVDIDDHVWNGVTVTPKDKVRLEGEVDKDWNSVEIDVKKITKG
ncbi:YgiW/YdeI family stress tolerance OB fold protein [Cronobacter muytjensii]|uniref:YgiW/YdeI family stress tolerance OB fold protein n=1 Tax=Cronobacter TaxID=413496 RepID=UPI000283F620|nr:MULTISPECIES: YgiW/YdeI family stress tolerance OB fold protein [Cronobacter]ELY6225512.1 YgiW/YdeI family stress tolerance OB fold protein [Cronobacter muytjensii]MDI6457360.1 YgiW/YdeI family stress tolerance OB fold protein [Cronobacter muytjensii]